MLAGLLIAIHDADDRPGMLSATLPFGGTTLIEYQARLLVQAGASQIVVFVARLTPELIGAINRIGRRGVTVDTVRSAAEAAEKLHPLARVLMLADSLVTTAATVEGMAHEGGDALLVLADADATGGEERLGGGLVWAGIARLDARRLRELADLPRDYDLQSTLLRLAAQARPVHVMLSADARRSGHGIEHGGADLAARGRNVLAAMVSGRRGWFDRLIVTPLARIVLPLTVPKAIPTTVIGGAALAMGVLASAALWFDRPVIGLLCALIASVGCSLAAILGDLRDEPGIARSLGLAAAAVPAIATLLLGYVTSAAAADGAAEAIAVFLVVVAVLAERAAGRGPRVAWWGSAPAYLLVILVGAVVAVPVAGLATAALYAVATAAAAIERLRQQA